MKSRVAPLLERAPWAGPALMLIVPLLALTVAIDLYDKVMLERILIGMFINVVLVVGLQLFTGNSGLVSFGHISFMAVMTGPNPISGLTRPDCSPRDSTRATASRRYQECLPGGQTGGVRKGA